MRARCLGFSLLEMAIALAVIGVLAAASVLFIHGPIALNAQATRQVDLLDQAGLMTLWLQRDLATALPNAISRVNTGNGFVLSLTPRPPASGTIHYRCAPNAAAPAQGTLERNGQMLVRGVAACRAMDPQAPAYRATAGRDPLVSLAFALRAGDVRLDVVQTVRVLP